MTVHITHTMKLSGLRVIVIAAQLNLRALDLDGNFTKIVAALENAKRITAQEKQRQGLESPTLTILALPDLTITGPGCGDALLRPALLRATMARLIRLERMAPKDFVITLGLPVAFNGRIYKAHAFICDGELRGLSCATSADLSPQRDMRQFSSWPTNYLDFISLDDREIPIGDIDFKERDDLAFGFFSYDRLMKDTIGFRDTFTREMVLDEKSVYRGIRSLNARYGVGALQGVNLNRCRLGGRIQHVSFAICRDAPNFALGRYFHALGRAGVVADGPSSCSIFPALEGVAADSVVYDGAAMIGFAGDALQAPRFRYSVAPAAGAVAAVNMVSGERGKLLFSLDRRYPGFFEPSLLKDYVRSPEFLNKEKFDFDKEFDPCDLHKRTMAWQYGDVEPETLIASWELDDDVKYEEFARATSLALFDYMRKCRAKGFALSLSGGADSATIATLVRLGVLFGCKAPVESELGVRRFLQWLTEDEKSVELGDSEITDASLWRRVASRIVAAFPKLDDLRRATERWRITLDFGENGRALTSTEYEECQRDLCGLLLTTFYQSTRNSGEVTRIAAREVARACGATHYEFDVDSIIESYKKMVSDALGEPWNWEKDDLALQNIQARGRGPSAWLVANKSNRLLLATGNRSECACGYATMDGDTCGALSPIAGVDKAFIRKWLVWMERTGVSVDDGYKTPRRRFSIPELKHVNEQQPTAELRPQEAKQTDESDLMPYAILNAFEQALIYDRLPFENAVAQVAKNAPELGVTVDEETLRVWGRRFCALWTASQWKRQRYAPGFQLDEYDLFPNSWASYPYLSAGFGFEFG